MQSRRPRGPDANARLFLTSGLQKSFVACLRTGIRRDWGGRIVTDIPVGKELWCDLRRQIARRTRNPLDAEDLLHSAYLRLQKYRKENVVKDPAAFLVRAACNISIDNFRRDHGLREQAEAFEVEDHAPLQDEVVAARARLERVKAGLERLTPRTREVFLMHRLQNLKYHEIASRLGISQSAVEKHIAKAVLFLTDWVAGW